jgi:hypothetical protein
MIALKRKILMQNNIVASIYACAIAEKYPYLDDVECFIIDAFCGFNESWGDLDYSATDVTNRNRIFLLLVCEALK